MTWKTSPKADGFGKATRGGENGEVLFINDLTDTTSRTTWQKSNPRIIIPRVSGYVELSSNLSVSYNGRNDLTYLGILAPNGGELVYKNWEVRITSVQNIVIRGLKSRPGDRNKEISTITGDAFTFSKFTSETEGCVNVYIDHSVGSWGTDELFSISRGKNLTVQYCMFYEPLDLPTVNEKGSPHGFGHIWGGENVSAHHNLHAFIRQRTPLFQNLDKNPNELIDIRNNVMYAWHLQASDLSEDIQRINFLKNAYYRKINYIGGGVGGAAGLGAVVQFRGTNEFDSSRAYLFGNTVKKFEGGNWVDVHPSLGDDPVSQRVLLYGTNGDNTTNVRPFVGVTTQFPIPSGTYDFEETLEESRIKINDIVGTLNRDVVDQRIIRDWNDGLVPITGSVTGIAGLIDAPEDSLHINGVDSGYPTISAGTQILDGPAPHYIPAWFTTKYSMSTVYDYTLAGDPIARPERFIIFKGGQGVQLSQYVGTVDYENDLIYNVYSVLGFHYVPISPTQFEIEILEGVVTPTTYTLTVQSSNPTFGTVSRSLSNPVTAGATDVLTATPVGTGVFQGWYLGSVSFANFITNDNPYNRVVNSDATIIASFVDGTPIPPEEPRKKWAKKRPVL